MDQYALYSEHITDQEPQNDEYIRGYLQSQADRQTGYGLKKSQFHLEQYYKYLKMEEAEERSRIWQYIEDKLEEI